MQAAPRRATSLLVLAPSPSVSPASDYSILMVKRSSKARFMANKHVFPGGVLETTDSSPDWKELTSYLAGGKRYGATKLLDDTDIRICGVREVFEETNLLISTPSLLSATRDAPKEVLEPLWHEIINYRTNCQKDSSNFFALFRFLAQHPLFRGTGIAPDIGRLAPWAHWVTPAEEKWRYDTYFYLAPLSEAPSALPIMQDESETTQFDWFSPQEAIASFERGDIQLAPPTWYLIKELCEVPTMAELLEKAKHRSMDPILPVIRLEEGGLDVILPGDGEYQQQGNTAEARNRITVRNGSISVLQHPITSAL